MAQNYRPENVINGSSGEAWCNGDYLAEITGFTAEIDLEFEDVNMVRSLAKHKKMIGFEGKGEVKLNKVTSRFVKLVSDNLKKGKQTVVTFITKLDDPDALGAERIIIKDATLEKLTLANWEAKKLTEETIPFSFTDWDPLDLIEG